MKKLTVKQQKFVDEFIKCGNATESAIKAGYSKKTAGQVGSENLKKPELKKAIDAEMQKIADSKIMKAQEALELFTSIARGETTETVVTAKGVVDDVPAGIKDRLSALKEIMKRYPGASPLESAQLKKLKEDTRVSKAKADAIENTGQDTETLLTSYLEELHKGVSEDEP